MDPDHWFHLEAGRVSHEIIVVGERCGKRILKTDDDWRGIEREK
jgi:hypothetical protein